MYHDDNFGEWEEALDIENMLEWCDDEDVQEWLPQEWLDEPIHYDDQYHWWM